MAKKEYKEIYEFEVVGKIGDSEKVFVLDKQDNSVTLLNDEKISVVLELIEKAREDKSNRYLFWTEKETEDEHKD